MEAILHNGPQQIEILEALAAFEAAAAGAGLDHELRLLKEKLRKLGLQT